MRDEWKKLIEDEMTKDVERIMEEINADPSYKDLVAPEEIHDRLFAQIHEYEERRIYEQLSDEDKELIRLGKVYRKRRKASKYLILVAAVLVVLGVGTVCIGENDNIFRAIKTMFAGQERTEIDSEDVEPTLYEDEMEVYEIIEEEYGFKPVKLEYLPENAIFYEAVFSTDMQSINLIYDNNNETSIIYIIRPNYRDASLGLYIEDEKIQEFKMIVNDIEIGVVEYSIVENGDNKWSATFEYQDVQYLIRINNMKQAEVEKIINNLGF